MPKEESDRGRPWVALFALAIEYLLFSFLFDASDIVAHAGDVVDPNLVGNIGPLLVLVAASGFVFRRGSSSKPTKRQPIGLRVGYGAAHVACFGASLVVAERLAASEPGSLRYPAAWLGGFGLLSVASAAWLLAAAGFRSWIGLRELTWGSLIGLLAWGAGLGTEHLWRPLSYATMKLVAALLRLFVGDVMVDTRVRLVGTPNFEVAIAPECSGYEGIGLIFVFICAYLGFFRSGLRFPQVLLAVPVGVCAVWVANALRIAALIMVGHWGYEDVALGGFHSKAGWVLFCSIALALVWLIRNVSFFSIKPETSDVTLVTNPIAPYLVPLLVVIGSQMIIGLLSTGFPLLYPLEVVAGSIALLSYWRPQRLGTFEWGPQSWNAVGIGVAVGILWIAFAERASPESGEAWMRGFLGLQPWARYSWLVLRVIGSVLLIPVVEEIAFRGFLLRRLISPNFAEVSFEKFTWKSTLLSSLAFGLLHKHWALGSLAGYAFAHAQRSRGRLGDAILAHATSNGAIAAWALSRQEWSLWM